ncbi:hypothetical protein BHE74_00055650, partial [Ensete ventricosum]
EVSYHSNLVMPRLWCRFEKMWFGHLGLLKGTLTKQPFVCPMDHLFEVIRFVRLECKLLVQVWSYMEVFSQYRDIKVLHFSSLTNAFRGFSDEVRSIIILFFYILL